MDNWLENFGKFDISLIDNGNNGWFIPTNDKSLVVSRSSLPSILFASPLSMFRCPSSLLEHSLVLFLRSLWATELVVNGVSLRHAPSSHSVLDYNSIHGGLHLSWAVLSLVWVW